MNWYKRALDEQLDLFEEKPIPTPPPATIEKEEKEDKKEEDNIRFLNIFNKHQAIFQIGDRYYGYVFRIPDWASKIAYIARKAGDKTALVRAKKMVEDEKVDYGYAIELEKNLNFPSGFKMIREI